MHNENYNSNYNYNYNINELKCPVCKIDSFLNPNIKIFISPCFHEICENCLYKIFDVGTSPCPQCGTLLRKINFISSTFEDIEVERECNIRKQILMYFKSPKLDHNSIEYDNWLEKFEIYVFNLMDEFVNDYEILKKIQLDKNDPKHFMNGFKEMEILHEAKITSEMKIVDTFSGNENLVETPKRFKKVVEIFGYTPFESKYEEIQPSITMKLFKLTNGERLNNDIFLKYCKFNLDNLN